MKVSLSWLNDFVDISGIEVFELAERLTMSGLEIEGVDKLEAAENVVTAAVKKVEKHPNADKLSVCEVSDGENVYNVVCGADNVAEGQIIPFAKVGAVLPGGFKIKKAKLRGVESFGMICSAAELNLEEKSDGIMPLPEDTPVNKDINEVLGLGDYVLDISITPNRADCLSVRGVAREVAALYSRKMKKTSYQIKSDKSLNASDYSYVKVTDEEKCPVYLGRIIKDVTIKPSPLWMQNRLRAVGVRPINNIVDITNYIMFEYGQPLHTFDLREIEGGIIVRTAKPGEKIMTLDGKERLLDESMLVIADESKPIGIAGVMGGEYSGIHDDTKDVFLECAYFKPENIRMTARKLGLQTDSSYRYERGIDRVNTLSMVDYAASLLKENADGSVADGVLSNDYKEYVPLSVNAEVDKINKLLGTEISEKEMAKILEELGFGVKTKQGELTVEVPPYRIDIERWQDLAEEVARIYGYNNIEATVPRLSADSVPPESFLKKAKNIKSSLKTLGFNEVINYSFMSERYLSRFDKKDNFVKLLNPISEDMDTLRTYVFPGVVAAAKQNINQGFKNIRLFEIAKTFINRNESIPEQLSGLAFCATSSFFPLSWNTGSRVDTFYYMKGVLDNLLKSFKINAEYEKNEKYDFLHPGKSAEVKVGGKGYGFIGQLHPNIAEEEDIQEDLYLCEIHLEKLINEKVKGDFHYEKFSVYPFVYKDLSVVVDNTVNAGDLLEYIKNLGPLVYDAVIYDIYQGDKIGENKLSLTFRIFYSALDRTLTDEETNKILEEIIEGLTEKYSAELR